MLLLSKAATVAGETFGLRLPGYEGPAPIPVSFLGRFSCCCRRRSCGRQGAVFRRGPTLASRVFCARWKLLRFQGEGQTLELLCFLGGTVCRTSTKKQDDLLARVYNVK